MQDRPCFNLVVAPDQSDQDARDLLRSIDEQLLIYGAIESALDNRHAVMDVLEAAVDAEDARQHLGRLLQIDEVGTQAVLDLQFRRLTARERQKVAERRTELLERRSTLTTGRSGTD